MAFSLKSRLAGLGLGTCLVGAFLSWPINAALNLGADHFKPTIYKQMYYMGSIIRGTDPDVIVMYKCDWMTAGNIISLKNQLNEGSDNARSELELQVVSVSYNGTQVSIPADVGSARLRSKHGELIFFRSGYYSYVSFEPEPKREHREVFTFHFSGPNEIVDEAELHLEIYETAKTANKLADYGNQVSGSNRLHAGRDAYQTPLSNGAIVFGWIEDDYLIGSASSDTIRGWVGDDGLYGLGGDDVLVGEHGSNELFGGTGSDVFVFHPDKLYSRGVYDVVVDFNPKEGDLLNFGDPMEHAYWDMPAPEPSEVFRVITEADYMDVFMSSKNDKVDGPSHIVRLLRNPNFDPMRVNFFSLVSSGSAQY